MRLIGSARRECLDCMILFDGDHISRPHTALFPSCRLVRGEFLECHVRTAWFLGQALPFELRIAHDTSPIPTRAMRAMISSASRVFRPIPIDTDHSFVLAVSLWTLYGCVYDVNLMKSHRLFKSACQSVTTVIVEVRRPWCRPERSRGTAGRLLTARS